MKLSMILVCNVLVFALVCPVGVAQTHHPSVSEIAEVVSLLGDTLSSSTVVSDSNSWTPEKAQTGPSWSELQRIYLEKESSYSEGNNAPFIMMAGYMDTEITWEDGGIFTMVAWVWDPENDVDTVELYYEGEPTDVFLLDDGQNADFGAGDTLYGLTFDVPAYALPAGEYVLELRARDSRGNLSDLWPYLTIHP